MITIENKGNELWMFGRRQDKSPYIQIEKTFRPYFYYENEPGEFKSIFGQTVKKLICNMPEDVRMLREKYKHYEADIKYVNRYLIDKINKIEKEPIRIWYMDIETSSEGGFSNPLEAKNPILSICIYDNFINDYYTINDVHENCILDAFIKIIKKNDPDILVAWNGDGFDFPYLINRINNIGLDANGLSRMNQSYVTKDKIPIIKGRILFDLMWGYKKVTQGQERESWSLEYISQYELKEGKEKYKGTLDELYKKNIKKFLEYNKRDVELLKLLDEKLKITEFYNNIRILAGCKFEDVNFNSKIVDSLILRFCKDKYILPSKQPFNKDYESFKGAFVYQPTKGLYKNIACADLNSLYPSIIISLNLSPETLLNEKEENCINIDEKFYYSKQIGVIPQIIQKLLDERKYYKKERDKFEVNSNEYKAYENLEQAVKVITNSIYGVLGSYVFRLFKKEVAETITYIGRKIINYNIEFLNNNNSKVVYGDTDSVFFDIDEKSISEIDSIIHLLNKSYGNFISSFNIENHRFNIECEKIFKTIFFTNAKKRYAGRLKYYKGKETDELLIVGFESKRSDNPQIIRDFQKQLFELVLEENSKEIIDKYIDDFRKTFKTLKEELGIPIGISKNLKEYKKLPIHIRAVLNANQYHNAGFKGGDKIKYVYIRKTPDKIPFDNVIAFKDKLWDDYVIDYERLEKRLIDNKVENIYEALGWIKPELTIPIKQFKQLNLFEDETQS